MEPIEAIWWIITCAFDELCNIRYKRSHAERESEAPQSHSPPRAPRLNDENTWAHFASVFFPYFLLNKSGKVEKWNALVPGVYFQTVEKLNGKYQPRQQQQQQHGVTKQQHQQTTAKQQLHHTSLWKVQFPLSLSLWLTYSHAFPHAGKIIRIASHSFVSFPLWLVFFSSFLFFSFEIF